MSKQELQLYKDIALHTEIDNAKLGSINSELRAKIAELEAKLVEANLILKYAYQLNMKAYIRPIMDFDTWLLNMSIEVKDHHLL